MMLAETKTEFEAKLSDFRESEKENWLNCVPKWAKYERVNLPLNLQETNNPVEVVNKQFKGFSNKHASNSIAVCCDSIFKYVRSTEINIEQEQISQNNKTTVPYNSCPIIKEFHSLVSSCMAQWLASQYLARSRPYEITELNETFTIKLSARVYQISNLREDYVSCTCYAHLSLNMPCRHIFFARNYYTLPLFNAGMVADRHKLKKQIEEFECEDVNLITSIENLDNVKSLVTSSNMSEINKYNAAHRVSQEIANTIKQLDQSKYEFTFV